MVDQELPTEDRGRVAEAVGEDVEAAIADGLARLGVDRDAVEIEVLDDGSRGLFGLGAREARVRLTVKPQPAPRELAVAPAEPIAPVAEEPAEEPVEPIVVGPAPTVSTEKEKDEAEVARGVLLELLTLMGMKKTRVDVRRAEPAEGEQEPPLVLNVHGPGTDALIGRRGKTMAALQHITRLIVGREVTGRVHLVVDVEGFKARREKSLHRLAHRMAEQAIHTDRTVVLEPMPPHERRIIHLALRDHPDVVTESVGERDRRKVTIIPR
jgi:spoIIIJ-associated protein